MTFTHTCRADFYKLSFIAQVFNRGTAAVTHAGTQATGHLENDGDHGALVGHAALNALGYQLVGVWVASGRFLKITVGTALLHGPNAAHAAIALIAATLE